MESRSRSRQSKITRTKIEPAGGAFAPACQLQAAVYPTNKSCGLPLFHWHTILDWHRLPQDQPALANSVFRHQLPTHPARPIQNAANAKFLPALSLPAANPENPIVSRSKT